MRMMRTKKHHSTGFSLMELLVSIVVMSVVSTIAVVMFSQVTDLWRHTDTQATLDKVAGRVLDEMTRDLSETLSPRLVGVKMSGTREEYQIPETTEERDEREVGLFWGRNLPNDRMVFPARILSQVTGREEAGLIMFHIDRATNTLVRTEDSLDAEIPLARRYPLADGIVGLCIEYAAREGDDGWVREWNALELPALVRISIAVMDPNRPWEQVARKAIVPLRVQ